MPMFWSQVCEYAMPLIQQVEQGLPFPSEGHGGTLKDGVLIFLARVRRQARVHVSDDHAVRIPPPSLITGSVLSPLTDPSPSLHAETMHLPLSVLAG